MKETPTSEELDKKLLDDMIQTISCLNIRLAEAHAQRWNAWGLGVLMGVIAGLTIAYFLS